MNADYKIHPFETLCKGGARCFSNPALLPLFTVISDDDTIAAVATPPGKGAIGIVRVSGPRALPIASELFRGGRDPAEMPGFSASLGWVEHQAQKIDQVLCLVMRAPKSYTTQDTAEFHCHGGPAPLRRVLQAVIEQGARPAGPGEFTRRAFLNGRIDLARAEAVADLIDSRTYASGRAAAAQLEGGLSKRLQEMRAGLLELLALLEAGIDFSDEEEDVTAIENSELITRLDKADAWMRELIEQAGRARMFRDGARVVIAGRPNAGKSTLMNRLLGEERVIVTPVPGTTRDVVEDMIEVGGAPVRLFDTAGLTEEGEPVESMGVERARKMIETADLCLFMLDGTKDIAELDREMAAAAHGGAILVINKCDLHMSINKEEAKALLPGSTALCISALTGEGMDGLMENMADALCAGEVEAPVITNVRHADALSRSRQSILRTKAAAADGLSHEFVASDLRLCLEALGEITGETATEEVLDMIFSRFCIGK